MNENYTLVRLNENNIDDLYKLKKSINSYSKVNLRKKYDTEYLGVKNIGYIAYSKDNEPAAFYGVIPMEFQYLNQNFLAAQSADTMTSPAHQRKGLFIILAKKTYKLAKKEGIIFVFGFPNENSFPGFKNRLNWSLLEKMQNYNFLIITFPIYKFSRVNKFLSSLYSKYKNFILNTFWEIKKDFIVSNNNKNSAVINKDLNYFLYKNDESYHRVIARNNLVLWIKVADSIRIGDWYFSSSVDESTKIKILKKIILKLKITSFFLGINRIATHVSKNSNIDNLLQNISNARQSLFLGKVDLIENKISDKIKCHFSDFDTF